jgi:hypothetical protein
MTQPSGPSGSPCSPTFPQNLLKLGGKVKGGREEEYFGIIEVVHGRAKMAPAWPSTLTQSPLPTCKNRPMEPINTPIPPVATHTHTHPTLEIPHAEL